MGCVISEPCFKATIFQRNYRKISWSFFYNFFKFHSKKKIGEPQHYHVISAMLYPKPFYYKVCCKETAMYDI